MNRALVIFGSFLALGVAACTNEVPIGPDDAAGTGGGALLATGAGAAAADLGDMGGAAGASPGAGKVVTADTDMAQHQSFTVEMASARPILPGPFFVTDVLADVQVTLFTVKGGDCAAPQTRVLVAPQAHGMRLPVLTGQSLCHGTTATGTLTVLGFKPY